MKNSSPLVYRPDCLITSVWCMSDTVTDDASMLELFVDGKPMVGLSFINHVHWMPHPGIGGILCKHHYHLCLSHPKVMVMHSVYVQFEEEGLTYVDKWKSGD